MTVIRTGELEIPMPTSFYEGRGGGGTRMAKIK